MRRELAFALALALFGCNSNLCARNSDCKAGMMCSIDGVCEAKSTGGGDDDDSSTVDAPTDTVDAPVDAPADAPDASTSGDL